MVYVLICDYTENERILSILQIGKSLQLYYHHDILLSICCSRRKTCRCGTCNISSRFQRLLKLARLY